MKKTLKNIALLSLFGCISHSAFAYDWIVTAHITSAEASYMPTTANFDTDVAGGSCGTGFGYTGATTGAASVPSAFALILTAVATGQTVTLYGNDDCSLSFIVINNTTSLSTAFNLHALKDKSKK